MKRGDLVTIALQGDYGKPRPALIIQADAFEALESVTVLRLTSDIRDAPSLRLTISPTAANGLRTPSQIMIDKAATLPREKIGAVIGKLDASMMRRVNQALIAFFDLEEDAA
ncbi:MAG: type II toxin-antitoxin system PemK/MazF family toxin [Hyphomicrobiales bacterium]|jgi:mRNA interferase MazF